VNDAVADIRGKLQAGSYQNEEHVRLSLVARLLRELGWDIWNPAEVNAEFLPVPTEDKTKVDLALFSTPRTPSVFIEVKAVNRISNLEEIERQLRDYNRNNTALFSIITDGRTWRFYYSQTGGEFSKKRFKTLDLLSDAPEDLERTLRLFLSKSEIDSGNAKKEAEALLRLTQKQRAMEDCLPKARRLVQEAPFPTLPDALLTLVAEQGFEVSREEAEELIASPHQREPSKPETLTGRDQRDVVRYEPERPPDLRYTVITEGRMGSESCRKWNHLVRAGIEIAHTRGNTHHELSQWLTANVVKGAVRDRGFHHVDAAGVSFQGMDANRAWENALILARKLSVKVEVRFSWRNKEGAAFPGKTGILHWSPA